MDEAKRYPATNRTLGRRMNSQMNISLPIELHEKLREIAWQERMPLSHLCRSLIEIGLEHRQTGEQAEYTPSVEPYDKGTATNAK